MSDANKIFELYAEAARPKKHQQPQPKMYVREQGIKYWFLPDGVCHRDDGPAVEYRDGRKFWFIKGKQFTDVAAWAAAALKYKKIKPTQQKIDAKIQQVMQQDLFS